MLKSINPFGRSASMLGTDLSSHNKNSITTNSKVVLEFGIIWNISLVAKVSVSMVGLSRIEKKQY